MATIAADAFSRTATGGWGTADTGGAWTVTNSTLFTVNGTAGVLTEAAGQTAYARLAAVSTTNSNLLISIPIVALPVGGTVYYYVHARSVAESAAATTSYGALITVAPTGVVTLYSRVNGTAANPVATGITVTTSTTLTVRVQVVGTSPTTIRAKVWDASTVEPSAWAVNVTDSTAGLQVAAGIALGTYLSSSTTNGPLALRWDALTVVDTTAATSNPTATVTQIGPGLIDARASTPGTPGNAITFAITPTGPTPVTAGVWYQAPGTTAVGYTVTVTEPATGASATGATTIPAAPTAATGGGSTPGAPAVFTGSAVNLALPAPGDPATNNQWGPELNTEVQKLGDALNRIITYLNTGVNA